MSDRAHLILSILGSILVGLSVILLPVAFILWRF